MDSTSLILGDSHIGGSTSLGRVGLGSALNSRVVDRMAILDWTLLQAVEVGAKHIFLTGDVFEEPRPHPYLITLLIGWLKKCEANDIHVHIIMGNHDLLRSGNFYTSPLDIITECEMENVSVYKDITTILLDGVAFTLMPFRDRKAFGVETNAQAIQLLRDIMLYELSSIPSTYRKVVVGHLALEKSLPVGDEIDDMMNELFCPLDMFAGYDYVWMGHIHKPQIMSRKPYIAHIGSMDISNFGETDQKKELIIFDIEGEEEFRTINVPTRPIRKVLVSVPKGTENTTQYVIDEITNNHAHKLSKAIVRLEVYLTGPELPPTNRTSLESCLYDLGAFHVAAISESKKLTTVVKDSIEENTVDNTIDVPAAIKLWANTQVEESSRNKFIEASMKVYHEFQLLGDK